MILSLTNWGDDALKNTILFMEGRRFIQEEKGYFAFPPGVYFSEDLEFMKSMVNHYSDIRYSNYKKFKDMTLGQYFDHLSSIKMDDGLRGSMQKDYLIEYSKKFSNRRKYKLLSIVMEADQKRVHFIYRGMFLFKIMPEYFIKFS